MRELYYQYQNKGLEIVGISIDEQESAWQKAIEKNEMGWIHLRSDHNDSENVHNLYNVRTIPHTVLIDHTGTIIAINLRGEELAEKVKELLDN